MHGHDDSLRRLVVVPQLAVCEWVGTGVNDGEAVGVRPCETGSALDSVCACVDMRVEYP